MYGHPCLTATGDKQAEHLLPLYIHVFVHRYELPKICTYNIRLIASVIGHERKSAARENINHMTLKTVFYHYVNLIVTVDIY